jgi:muramoyltetrapeptide carboxypeptidase
MIKPAALRPGDCIAVVSPSSPIDEERLNGGLKLLHDRGYKTKVFPHVLDSDFFLAGGDETRAADLSAAFHDPECQAVLCSRGGYGCARLFPFLDLPSLAATGKMFMGFSDITTLHVALNQHGLVTFHTPMALTLSYERVDWVYESFFNLLVGNPDIPTNAKRPTCVVPGIVDGVTAGGCLILVCDGMGTPEGLDATGKIVFLEDVDENPHRIDALFTHLLNAGVLESAAGIVVGEMTGTDEKSDPTIGAKPWREVVTERLRQVSTPSVIDFPFGHMKTMLSIPMGIHARLDAEAGKLTYLESPCA